jgi:hypothetical protein
MTMPSAGRLEHHLGKLLLHAVERSFRGLELVAGLIEHRGRDVPVLVERIDTLELRLAVSDPCLPFLDRRRQFAIVEFGQYLPFLDEAPLVGNEALEPARHLGRDR